jgi:hypothetical protein
VAVEDQRVAIAFSITLSSQLMAASMAMLAVEAAYVWYALGSRNPVKGFEVVAALAALAIATSIFIAGKAIARARNAGFDGKWSLDAGKSLFNLQALFLIIAIALLGIMFALSGPIRESSLDKRVNDLSAQVAALREEVALSPPQKQEPKPEGSPSPKVNETTRRCVRSLRNGKRHR